MLAGAAALPALAAPSIGAAATEGEFVRLYREFRRHAEAVNAALDHYKPECDDAGWEAVNAACAAQQPVIDAIRAARARTVFDIGVKLSAISVCDFETRGCDPDELRDTAVAALRDIDALVGTDFASVWEDEA